MTRSSSAPDTTDSTAAALLQRAGLRTLCLEANTYAGGMAATVELIDGFRYEIAGSVQFPTPSEITKDLGLDTLPTVDADVMSVNIGEAGEEADDLLPRPDGTDDPPRREARQRRRHGHGRTHRLEPRPRTGARPLRRPQTTQDDRRDVRLRHKRIRAPGHPRDTVRLGDGRHRPLPAEQGEARRHARHARVPRHQLHLPRALHPRQRHLPGLRPRRPRRGRPR